MNSQMTSLKVQHSEDKVIRNSQCGPPFMSQQEMPCDGMADADLGAPLLQSAVSDTFGFINEDNRAPVIQHKRSMNIDGCVAEDSQSKDSGLYLLNCKIHLVGFDASEMRRLVNMVRRGGGSRYMSLNGQLTHIVVGTPTENEKKEVRSLSTMGVINVVRTLWLEDCEREKKEIPVLSRHSAYKLLLPEAIPFSKGSVSAMPGLKQANPSTMQPTFPNDRFQSLNKAQLKVQHGVSDESQDNKSSVFKGRSFRFSTYFPDIQRAEIVDWIHEGGGKVVDSRTEETVNYTVESHGVLFSPTQFSGATKVSSHWIYSCLQDGYLLDVSSHILFSPLQCRVPLPGFIGLHFYVSQYEEKDRALLRNVCHILGGRLLKRLTKKVNYVICKFTEGPRYEAARELGIQTVTIEWIWECVRQNKIVASSQFLPKAPAAAISDQEAGVSTMSQYPTQAVGMISASQPTLDPKVISGRVENRVKGGEVSKSVPDVAAAIEDLLEQTSKIHDQKKSPTASDKNVSEVVFTSDCSRLDHDLHAHSVFGWSNHWTRRSNEKDDNTNPGGEENTNIYGGFSETQAESQVVGYEEDLSGRQMIIDSVRTKSKAIIDRSREG
ncbi:hypothetical protein L6452_40783 [Arctium lappa]|uniref:Uncharacterized protein n=1 Tax=Arctium lappa TaxID=4217 RepID=A0ACB8XS05_ARCLA|nr:hypothetical protein L6452_40783 [Arctium lappa]